MLRPSHDDWDERLPCCEFAINNAWNAATDSKPFFLNHGQHPRTPINVDVVCKLPATDTFVGRIKDSIARACESLQQAQQRMEKAYNADHRHVSFEIGEFVFLSAKGVPMAVSGTRKFMPKQLGPF